MERELLPPVAFLQDVASRDVGRQQIRRELNPPEIQRQQPRQCLHEFRLPQPRKTFQQDVALREQRRDDFIDHLFLAENHAPQFVDEFRDIGLCGGDGFGVRRGLGSGFMCGILSAVGTSARFGIFEVSFHGTVVARRQRPAHSRLPGSSGKLHSCGSQASLRRFFWSAGKDRDGRPVVRAPHRTGRKSGRLEAIEGKGLVTPCQVRISAAAIDATATGLAVVLGRSS